MVIIDTFEPTEIERLMAQSIPVTRQHLVSKGFADYLWIACDGHRIQVERKQWGEVLSDPDHVEEQLRREMVATEETVLLVEGVAESTPWGMDVYGKSVDKPYWRIQRSYGSRKHPQVGLYHRIQAWFWSLDKAGVSVYRTSHQGDTAQAIVAWYKSSQKQEHTTLQRYIKPRINPVPFDPQVLTLMGIERAGLGEVKAKALIQHFGSVWAVVNAPVSELCQVDGIGMGLAKRLVDAVGREYYE